MLSVFGAVSVICQSDTALHKHKALYFIEWIVTLYIASFARTRTAHVFVYSRWARP